MLYTWPSLMNFYKSDHILINELKSDTKVFVIHGTYDEVIPIAWAKQFVDRHANFCLKEIAAKHRMITKSLCKDLPI